MMDINTENRVCMFYVINRLNQILTKSDDPPNDITQFYNELVFNLGVNTVRNHNNPKEDNNG